jgi:hypothetical protein
VAITRLIFGRGVRKGAERRGPEFHALQIPMQVLKRIEQIADSDIFGPFKHCYQPFGSSERVSLPPSGIKGLLALWFHDC